MLFMIKIGEPVLLLSIDTFKNKKFILLVDTAGGSIRPWRRQFWKEKKLPKKLMLTKDFKHLWRYRHYPKTVFQKLRNGVFRTENIIRFYLSKSLGIPFKPRLFLKFPNVILCEVTNHCNLSCPMCFQKNLKRKRGFMNFNLYRKIVDEVCLYPNVAFRPLGNGEPLLHPRLPEMIAYAKTRGIKQISITTNGCFLNKKMARKLLGNGLDSIEISLDAVSPKVYQKMRPGSDFHKVKKNVLDLIKLKKEKFPNLHITLNFVDTPFNHKEIPAFQKFWSPKVDYIDIFPFHTWVNTADKVGESQKRTGFPCRQLWERVLIYWNGDVSFCCNDPEGRSVVDNLKGKSLKEIWLGERYRLLRRKHIKKNFKGLLCNSCEEFWPWIGVH